MKKKIKKSTKFLAIVSSVLMMAFIAVVAFTSAFNQYKNGNNVITIENKQNINADISFSELSGNFSAKDGVSNKLKTENFSTKFNYKQGDAQDKLNALEPLHFNANGDAVFYKLSFINKEENDVNFKIYFKGISNKKIEAFIVNNSSYKIIDNFDNVSTFKLEKENQKDVVIKLKSKVDKKNNTLAKNTTFFNIFVEIYK